MRKLIQIALFFLFVLGWNNPIRCQEQPNQDPDGALKERLYTQFKKEVQGYDKKHFDELFFEFMKKQTDTKVLTKEEFYTYTIKIAIYSEKLGLLYKNQKAESLQAKKEWFDRSYSDYLATKQ